MKEKLNKFWIGTVVCFFVPLILFVSFWTPLSHVPLSAVFDYIRYPVFLQYMLFCQLPTLVVLFYGYQSESWNLCRGSVLGLTPYLGTLIYLFM